MGICNCTRCLRQDVITQLKAFLIAQGGTFVALNPRSLIEQNIAKQFKCYLGFTLLANPHLFGRFPAYCEFLNVQSSHQQLQTETKSDSKLHQLPNLLDFSVMAEGFENLMASKKTDSLVIQAINETTQIARHDKKKGAFTLTWAFKLLDSRARQK
jgi:hypothetical protein